MKGFSRVKQSTVKVFGMTNQLIAESLSRVGKQHNVDIGHLVPISKNEKDQYYSQFDLAVRAEAAEMSKHYELFYCLEKSIRQLITEVLEDAHGPDWWDKECVPQQLQDEVRSRIQREADSGMTVRSDLPLDFTNFGELSGIISHNWELFGGILKSKKAVTRILSGLNLLRGPIAHCAPLAEDEVLRLQLALSDWFRQQE